MKGKFLSLRDPDGKGLIGCMFMIVIIAVAIYLGIVLFPIYYSNFNLESEVKTEASRAGAHFLDDEAVVKDVIDVARRNDIRLTRQNITIDRFAGQVHINVRYTVPVDFGLFERDLNFEIRASSFIGAL